jgi:hypothetical protein
MNDLTIDRWQVLYYVNQNHVRKNINLTDEDLKLQFVMTDYDFDQTLLWLLNRKYLDRRDNNCLKITENGEIKLNEWAPQVSKSANPRLYDLPAFEESEPWVDQMIKKIKSNPLTGSLYIIGGIAVIVGLPLLAIFWKSDAPPTNNYFINQIKKEAASTSKDSVISSKLNNLNDTNQAKTYK